jgi:hypothetical protein
LEPEAVHNGVALEDVRTAKEVEDFRLECLNRLLESVGESKTGEDRDQQRYEEEIHALATNRAVLYISPPSVVGEKILVLPGEIVAA